MTANHTLRTKSPQKRISDTYEVAESIEQRQARAIAQNDVFRAAMLKAIGQGKERVKEGVKTSDPNDGTVLRSPSRPATFVFTASSINTV